MFTIRGTGNARRHQPVSRPSCQSVSCQWPRHPDREPRGRGRAASGLQRVSRPRRLDQRLLRRLPAHRCRATAEAGGSRRVSRRLRSGGRLDQDNTRRVLEQEIGGRLDWHRLALTEEQVEDYDLPIITKSPRPPEAVETEPISLAGSDRRSPRLAISC